MALSCCNNCNCSLSFKYFEHRFSRKNDGQHRDQRQCCYDEENKRPPRGESADVRIADTVELDNGGVDTVSWSLVTSNLRPTDTMKPAKSTCFA